MNYLELCQRTHLKLGVGPESAGSLPATVVGQTGTLLDIVTYVRQAWTETQQERTDWLWMQSTGTINTVAGTQDYSLVVNSASQSITSITRTDSTATATKIGHGYQSGQRVTISGASQTEYNGTVLITSVTANTFTYTVSGTPVTPATGTITAATVAINGKSVIPYSAPCDRRYILVHTGSIGLSDQQPCYFLEPDEFEGYYTRRSVATSSGRPIYYTVRPNGQISLFPIPDQVYVLTIKHRTNPSDLTADASTPELPAEFHMYIVYKAMTYYGLSNESNRLANTIPKLMGQMFHAMVREQTPRINTWQ